MKKILISFSVLLGVLTFAQNTKTTTINAETEERKDAEKEDNAAALEKAKLPKPYHPEENAAQKLEELISQAQESGKNIMIQAGGNWCIWCLRFDKFVNDTPELKKIVDNNYLYYHLNYSPENKNPEVFERYGNPGEEFGYPVFIVLDKDGNQIHTQSSEVLEEGKGYSVEKVKEFFTKWSPNS